MAKKATEVANKVTSTVGWASPTMSWRWALPILLWEVPSIVGVSMSHQVGRDGNPADLAWRLNTRME